MSRPQPPFRAISIKQPWAGAIFAPVHPKDVENRSWPTVHRGKLYIHTTQRHDTHAPDWVWDMADDHDTDGVILGTVDLYDCDRNNRRVRRSTWAEQGMWHWWFATPFLFARPVPCPGQRSLWPIPERLWQVLRDLGGED